MDAIDDEGWRPGPTVFAIAWIPKFYYRAIPRGLLKHRNWLSWCGMLLTGNPPPPPRFDGPVDLERFALRKEYRGILGYRNVRIRPPHEDEDQYEGEAGIVRVVGYTPLPAGWYSLGE